MMERSLEVKLPIVWTDDMQRWEDAEKKVRRESQSREDQGRESQRKS